MYYPMGMKSQQDSMVLSALWELAYEEVFRPTKVENWVALLLLSCTVLSTINSLLRLWVAREEEYVRLLEKAMDTPENTMPTVENVATPPVQEEKAIEPLPSPQQEKEQKQQPMMDSKLTSNTQQPQSEHSHQQKPKRQPSMFESKIARKLQQEMKLAKTAQQESKMARNAHQHLLQQYHQRELQQLMQQQKDKANASTKIQAIWRGHQQRKLRERMYQASIAIQSIVRGSIVRHILSGRGLSTLAHALVQEEDAINRCSSRLSRTSRASRVSKISRASKANTESRHFERKGSLVAARTEDIPTFSDVVSNENSLSSCSNDDDNNNSEFGSKVKAVMEMRMRLLAVVVLQSWYRMVRCRKAYRRLFSSLNTQPITNLPGMGPLPTDQPDTQEAISFISSLSSWSSTWNRRHPSYKSVTSSKLGPVAAAFKEALKAKNDAHQIFNASPEDQQAIRNSITFHTSVITIQTWWRLCMVKRGRRQRITDRAPEFLNSVVLSVSYITEVSNEDDDDDTIDYVMRGERHCSDSSNIKEQQYYSQLWTATLDKVAECQNMCTAIDLQGARDNLTAMTSATGEDRDDHEDDGCNLISLLCKSPRNRTKTKKVPTGKSATSSASPRSECSSAGIIELYSMPKRSTTSSHRKKVIQCNGGSIYYVPSVTSTDAGDSEGAAPKVLSPNASSKHGISTPPQFTFSSGSRNVPNEEESDEEHFDISSQLRCMVVEAGRRKKRNKNSINYAFCASPPVITSVSSNSSATSRSFNSSRSESSRSYHESASTGSFYSIDEPPSKEIDGIGSGDHDHFNNGFVCGARLQDGQPSLW